MINNFLIADLSNKNTYMSYVRTGLTIIAIAIPFKMYSLIALGIFFIIIGTAEFYYIEYILDIKKILNYKYLKYVPLFITSCILIIVIHQIYKTDITEIDIKT